MVVYQVTGEKLIRSVSPNLEPESKSTCHVVSIFIDYLVLQLKYEPIITHDAVVPWAGNT